MFRVVPDQLRISEGWVRCGHCTEVFDAALHLQPQAVLAEPAPLPASEPAPESAPEPAPLPDPLPLSVPEPAEAPVASLPFAVAPAGAPAALPPAFDFLSPPVSPLSFTPSFPAPEFESVSPTALAPSSFAWGASPTSEVAPEALTVDAGTVERAMADLRQGDVSPQFAGPLQGEIIAPPIRRESLPDDAPSASPEEIPGNDALPQEDMSRRAAAIAETTEEPTESTIEDMSFVRDARRKAFWRRPVVRVALVMTCLLLIVSLALQVAVHERDRIAAIDPRAKPWLDELCGPLQCSVKPLRQIESIVIESSAFNKVRGNAYRFSISLRNKSTVPLAMPGIELALTDSQDQPMLRRVLMPADLGAATVIAPGAEWSASLPVSVAPTTQTARIAGYRLLAFYP
jgi:predicted Zn finger-like uncharacterized protein